jgi:CheY-like chemotaxis protein
MDKKLILSIDDDPMFLRLITNFLSPFYALMVCKSAAEALILMEKNKPDLILLDIEMPNISGLEFLHNIKKNPRLMKIPVVVVTGHSGSHFIERVEKTGANSVVAKPIDGDDLLKKIKDALENPKKNAFGV